MDTASASRSKFNTNIILEDSFFSMLLASNAEELNDTVLKGCHQSVVVKDDLSSVFVLTLFKQHSVLWILSLSLLSLVWGVITGNCLSSHPLFMLCHFCLFPVYWGILRWDSWVIACWPFSNWLCTFIPSCWACLLFARLSSFSVEADWSR